MNTKSYIRYGEAFKRQIVDEIESGKHSGAPLAIFVFIIAIFALPIFWPL